MFARIPRIIALAALAIATVAPIVAAECVDYTQFAHLVGRETISVDMNDLVADEHHAYTVSFDEGVVVLDLTDPRHPQPLDNVGLPARCTHLSRRGATLFASAATGGKPGLYAVDVTDPADPSLSGSMILADGYRFTAVHGSLLLARRHLLDTVDVIAAADPGAMTIVADIPMDALAMISGGGSVVYARTRTHVEVWDLSDPTLPVLRGSLDVPDNGLSGRLAMVGADHLLVPGYGGYDVGIIDVSDPGAPVHTGTIGMRYTSADILVDGSLAYIALDSGAVDLFDLSDLTAPVHLGSLVGGANDGHALSGQHLVCANAHALSVYDAAGAHLAYPDVGTHNWGWGFSYSAARHGHHIYVGSDVGLQVFDVSDYAAPANVFSGPALVGAVIMVGDLLYAGHTDGLTVYSLDDPAAPAEVVSLEMAWWSRIPEFGGLFGDVFLVGEGDSLLTFDVGDPADPRRLGARYLPHDRVKVDGSLAYVLADDLHIVDLTDPVGLPTVGTSAQPNAEDLAVIDNHVYLCAYQNHLLWIIDASDPTAPTVVGSMHDIYLRGLSAHGNLLLGTQGGWGVQLLDVTDPLQPAYAGHLYHGYDMGWVYRARVLGDLVWVGSDEGVAFVPAPCVDDVTAAPDPVTPGAALTVSAYPNPFNPRVMIRFEVPRRAEVALTVFDVRGRVVRRLLTGEALDAGPHGVIWNGCDDQRQAMPAGTYLARITVGGQTVVQKLSLVK